jgi:hypothetical protein
MADMQTTWFHCSTCDELHQTDNCEVIPYKNIYGGDTLFTCDRSEVWYCYDTKELYHNDVEKYGFYNGNTELYTVTDHDLWYCDDCETYHHHYFDEQYSHSRGSTCNSCNVVECECCNDYFHTQLVDMIRTERVSEICPHCYDSHYFTCDNCDGVFHLDYYHSEGECEDCYSGDGFDRPDAWCDNVYSYGTNVLNILSFGEASSYGYLGIEYETIVKGDSRGNIELAVNRLLKVNRQYWIATSDSSLDGQNSAGAGVEFVTRPDSYENHIAHFTKVFENYHDDLGNTHGCGMHVHLSIEAFIDDNHIDKVAALLESLTDEQLKTIVGRKPTSYCDRLGYKQSTGKYKDNQNGRYRMLNVRDSTVEFRLCRTTRKLDRLKTRLQFILSVVHFCSIYDTIDLQQFFSYCENNAYRYPELWNTVKPIVETEFSDYWNVVFSGLNNHIQTTLELQYA